MKHLFKHFLLAAVMILTSGNAWAIDKKGLHYEYEKNASGAIIGLQLMGLADNYEQYITDGNVEVPEAIVDRTAARPMPVLSVGEEAFKDCDILEKIDLSKCTELTKIHDQAFRSCDKLFTVDLPSGLEEIGESAFQGCGNLSSIYYLPESLKIMGSFAFAGTELSHVTIPKGIEFIGASPFMGCLTLKELDLRGDNEHYLTLDNVLYSKEEMDGKVQYSVVSYPAGKEDPVFYLPEEVVALNYGAFADNWYLVNVVYNKNLIMIHRHSFEGCNNLRTAYLPEGMEMLDDEAYYGCYNLQVISIPTTMHDVGVGNFTNPKLQAIIINRTETFALSENAFYQKPSDCKLIYRDYETADKFCTANIWKDQKYYINMFGKSCSVDGLCYILDEEDNTCEVTAFDGFKNLYAGYIDVPEQITWEGKTYDVTRISHDAFAYCDQLLTLHLPASITQISDKWDYGEREIIGHCENLTSLKIDGLTTTGNGMCNGCESLTKVKLPDCIKIIGENAFSGCSALKSIEIPEGVEQIGHEAFANTALAEVELPASLKTIGAQAFLTASLTDVTCHAVTPPVLNEGIYIFSKDPTYNKGKLRIPDGTEELYSTAPGWKPFFDFDATIGTATPRCAKPTITLVNGKLRFNCETPGAQIRIMSLSCALADNLYKVGKEVVPDMKIRFYAFADNYEVSVTVEEELPVSLGLFGDINGDGRLNVGDPVALSRILLK